MQLYCTEEFKSEFERIIKNNSYRSLEKEIATHYCGTTFKAACNGDLLGVYPQTSNPETFYIKKRLNGKGGYRVYLFAVVKKDSVYLAFVHPKTGKYGLDNITAEKKKELLKEVLGAIKSDELYEIKADLGDRNKITFIKKVAVASKS